MPSLPPAPQPPGTAPSKGKKLLDQVRERLRVKHYSYRTEQTYVDWIRRFIIFHKKRHPKEMAEAEIQAFITHLAVERNVAVSTHTVLASGARGTRRSALSSSCTSTCWKRNWSCRPLWCARDVRSACQRF